MKYEIFLWKCCQIVTLIIIILVAQEHINVQISYNV